MHHTIVMPLSQSMLGLVSASTATAKCIAGDTTSSLMDMHCLYLVPVYSESPPLMVTNPKNIACLLESQARINT